MTTSTSIARTELHSIAKDAFLHALKSVAPEQLVQSAVQLDETKTKLKIASQVGTAHAEFNLCATPSILILGAGKATQELVSGLLHVLKDCSVPKLTIQVQASYPKGQTAHSNFPILPSASVSLLEASHPISDECTVNATNEQIKLLYNCQPNTLAIVLMSGGGSALYETTESFGSGTSSSKITLSDLQGANKVLIESGASITEINIVRKHFSQVKGGRTAQHAMKSGKISAMIGLYLSDVVGNDLSSVASGPTCPDVSTFSDCQAIFTKYGIRDKMPKAIIDHIDAAVDETPKPGDKIFENKVFNFLIGSADTSAQAAATFLIPHGFSADIFSNQLDGEASNYGNGLVDFISQKSHLLTSSIDPHVTVDRLMHRRMALVATGEFTVTIKGKGVGGRNQEMLLALLHHLAQDKNLLSNVDFAVLSCAFDGIEGNSPATGAIVDSSSVARLLATPSLSEIISKDGLVAFLKAKLENNDSFSVFGPIQDAIITGYTGTNVNDLTMILLQSK
jgi:glycerate 2-kinase